MVGDIEEGPTRCLLGSCTQAVAATVVVLARLRLSVTSGLRTVTVSYEKANSRRCRDDVPIDDAVPVRRMRQGEKVEISRYRCHKLGSWIAGMPRAEWSCEMKHSD